MNDVFSANELERLRQGLGDLPDTMPPRAVWHRIREQARAEGLLVRPASRQAVKFLVGAAIAAAVVLAVLRAPAVFPPRSGDEMPGTPALQATPGYAEQNMVTNTETLKTLMVQSQLLERSLRAIPYQPRVEQASTAATISNLEDRIAAIDYELNVPANRMSLAEKQLFWRERVRLMDSLVMLRYAQAQRSAF